MKKITAFLAIMFCLALFFAAAPSVEIADAEAQNVFRTNSEAYEPLSPITDPASKQPIKKINFGTYIRTMYRIGIGACFVLAVIMFTWAGIEYIVAESMFGKSDAKGRIQAALIGLSIALVSYILLQVINPDLLIIRQDLTPETKSATP